MLDSDIDRGQQRSLTMEVEVGDDVAAGPSRLGYNEQRTLNTATAIVTRATRASPAPGRIYNARV